MAILFYSPRTSGREWEAVGMIKSIQLDTAGKLRIVIVSYQDTETQKAFSLEDISSQLVDSPNAPNINYVAAAILDALSKCDLYDGVLVELYKE